MDIWEKYKLISRVVRPLHQKPVLISQLLSKDYSTNQGRAWCVIRGSCFLFCALTSAFLSLSVDITVISLISLWRKNCGGMYKLTDICRVWFVCLSGLNQKCLLRYIHHKNVSGKIIFSLIFNVIEHWPLLVKKNLPTELVAFWNAVTEIVSPWFMPCGIFLFKSLKKYVGNLAK